MDDGFAELDKDVGDEAARQHQAHHAEHDGGEGPPVRKPWRRMLRTASLGCGGIHRNRGVERLGATGCSGRFRRAWRSTGCGWVAGLSRGRGRSTLAWAVSADTGYGAGWPNYRPILLPCVTDTDCMSPAKTLSVRRSLSRNIGWVTEAEQAALRGKRVAIAGRRRRRRPSAHLARLGVGAFTIADMDRFDLVNFNRQAGAMMSTLDRPKVEVMAEMARDINPELDIRIFPGGVNEANPGDFLDGRRHLDGLDFFAFQARRTPSGLPRARHPGRHGGPCWVWGRRCCPSCPAT